MGSFFYILIKHMANNYGTPHMPKLIKTYDGTAVSDRTSIAYPILDSAALYIGQFVSIGDRTNGAEFGIGALADDGLIYGFVEKFTRKGSETPIQDDPDKAGTVTDATSVIPMKYTASSTNDESNTTSAKGELVHIVPLVQGDILEVSLFNDAGTAAVNRGTTTAAGTTDSSANFGVSMPVELDAPFALREAGATKAHADNDFMVVKPGFQEPAELHRVYVQLIGGYAAFLAAAS